MTPGFLLAVSLQFFLLAFSHAQEMHSHNLMYKDTFQVMMNGMMAEMNRAGTGGSADETFLLQMIPHHNGAIEMARYEIRFGKNAQMRQLAKSILAEQAVEIQKMQYLQHQPSEKNKSDTASLGRAMGEAMRVMMQNMPAHVTPADVDRRFAGMMIPHHQAGIDMAKAIIAFGHNPQLKSFASQIISAQQIEIAQMQTFLTQQQ